MKKIISALSLLLVFILLFSGCGASGSSEAVNGSTSSDTESAEAGSVDGSSSEESEGFTSEVRKLTIDDETFSEIKSIGIRQAIIETVEDVEKKKTSESINYIFITDTHIDTTQSEGNVELCKKSIEYAKKIAELGDIDFICLGGDLITGWFDRKQAIEGFQQIAEAARNSPVPIIIARGNHDNNISTTTEADKSLQISNSEFYDYTQGLFRLDTFHYDESVTKGLYFYFDVPEKKTRVVCLDSYKCEYEKEQLKWLANEVLTIKDEGWKYAFMSHVPIDIRYESEMTHEISGSSDIKIMTTALNLGDVAKCSFGNVDFTDFKSKIVVFNFGHTHLSYMEWNDLYKCFCASSHCTGHVGGTKFDYVDADDGVTARGTDNADIKRYCFDVMIVDETKMERIRFGNGEDKTITANWN